MITGIFVSLSRVMPDRYPLTRDLQWYIDNEQGIGRLLRSKDDRGVMAILDKRLYTKSYGRQVLAALPPARRTNDLRDVERFFAAE